jgi:hypothetical protein
MPLLNMGPGCARWSILIDDNALNLGTDILNYFDEVFSSSIHPSRRTRYKIEFEALDPMSRPKGRTWDRQIEISTVHSVGDFPVVLIITYACF